MSRTALVLASLFIAQSRLVAQTPREFGAIGGIVVDSLTRSPVDGAIVYVALSGIGTSTGADGRFLLRSVPPGDREVIVSRVGFRRVLLTAAVAARETTNLDVTLPGAPVTIPGGETVAEAPSGLPAPPLFFPDGGERSWCAFGSETEVPVGILYTEKLLFFYHLDTMREEGEAFARLWLLVYNGSEDTVEINAARAVRMDIGVGGRRYADVRPVPASLPKAPDSTDPAPLPRNLPVERTLYTLASQSQLFLDEAERFDRMGGGPFLGESRPPEHPHGVNPRHLRDVYDRSTHAGSLGHFRVGPGAGVDGRLVYPMPGFVSGSDTPAGRPAETLRFEVRILTPASEERIDFTMH